MASDGTSKSIILMLSLVLLSLSCTPTRPTTQAVVDSNPLQATPDEQAVAGGYIPELEPSHHAK